MHTGQDPLDLHGNLGMSDQNQLGITVPLLRVHLRSIDERWECLHNNLDDVILYTGQNVIHQLRIRYLIHLKTVYNFEISMVKLGYIREIF